MGEWTPCPLRDISYTPGPQSSASCKLHLHLTSSFPFKCTLLLADNLLPCCAPSGTFWIFKMDHRQRLWHVYENNKTNPCNLRFSFSLQEKSYAYMRIKKWLLLSIPVICLIWNYLLNVNIKRKLGSQRIPQVVFKLCNKLTSAISLSQLSISSGL